MPWNKCWARKFIGIYSQFCWIHWWVGSLLPKDTFWKWFICVAFFFSFKLSISTVHVQCFIVEVMLCDTLFILCRSIGDKKKCSWTMIIAGFSLWLKCVLERNSGLSVSLWALMRRFSLGITKFLKKCEWLLLPKHGI